MDFGYQVHPSHLEVVFTGAFDAGACMPAIGEIMRLCQQHGLRAVLVDARAIRELVAIADRFTVASSLSTHGPPRIAVLVTPENEFHSRAFENTAANRGVPVKTTSDEDEARRFLGIEARPGR